jgi:hypothetical protein
MSHADYDRLNEQASEAPPEEQLNAPKSGDPVAPTDPSTPAVPIAEAQSDRPRRPRRRRRRKGPRPESAATSLPAGAGEQGNSPSAAGIPVLHEIVPGETAPPGNTPNRLPRNRSPRGERPHEGTPREARSPGRGARGKDGREPGPRGPKNRRYGKSGSTFERKPEPKLTSFESVVDRGFENVTDEADNDAVRRVSWTIVKRTVADQRSTKLISAVYVLQRDGVDTEFATLGTARAAVNKTISHPEKLTRSKSEYAAAKKK